MFLLLQYEGDCYTKGIVSNPWSTWSLGIIEAKGLILFIYLFIVADDKELFVGFKKNKD